MLADAKSNGVSGCHKWLRRFYYAKGCNLQTAASRLGLGKRTLWAWLKRNGFETKNQSEAQSGNLNGFAGKKHKSSTKAVIGTASRKRQDGLYRGRHGRYGNDGKHPFGEKNPTYKNGVGFYRRTAGDVSRCRLCQKVGRTHVHHIDTNRKNNKPDNLLVVCVKCHSLLHPRKRNALGQWEGGDAKCLRSL